MVTPENSTDEKQKWLIDSGASSHMTCEREYITNYRIGGIFRGEKFLRISCFRKKLYTENKILYGSHLIFDRFAKI